MRDICDQTQDGEFSTTTPQQWADGYYWARHMDGSTFVCKREGPSWYACGLAHPMVSFSPDKQIIKHIPRPEN